MIKIRKAKLVDVPLLLKEWKPYGLGHDQMMIDADSRTKAFLGLHKNVMHEMKSYFTKNILSRNGLFLIAEDSGIFAGFGLCLIKKGPEINAHNKKVHISDLYVRKEYRGRKISSMFYKEMKAWAKKKGLKIMSLMVYCKNKNAYNIYKKWGFIDFHLEMRKKI